RVVCWSATRGEGGQNRVTSYAGSELGVYRTWESMQASTIDGGESWFGPFYDYDYSKSGAETLEKWGKDRLVAEIVRAIRAAQPAPDPRNDQRSGPRRPFRVSAPGRCRPWIGTGRGRADLGGRRRQPHQPGRPSWWRFGRPAT